MTNIAPARRGSLAVVLTAGLITQALLFAITPALPRIAHMGGAEGPLIAQLAISTPALGMIIAGVIAGGLIERISARRAIIAALAGFALFGMMPMLADSPALLLPTRLLLGIACGITTTAAAVLLAATYEGEARARMIGYQISAGGGTAVISVVISGAIVSRLDWHLCFLLYGIPTAILILLAVFAVPAGSTSRPDATQAPGVGFWPVLRLLWPAYLLGCALLMVSVSTGSLMPFLLVAHGTSDAAVQALVIAMKTLGSMTSSAFFGRLHASLGARYTLALALGVGALGLAIVAIGHGPLMIGLGTLIEGFGVGLYLAYPLLVVTTLSSPQLQPRGLALLSSAMFLGGFLYPAFTTPLTTWFGLSATFMLVAVAMAVGTMTTLASRRGRLLLN